MADNGLEFYLYDEARLGEVPSPKVAKNILQDLLSGKAIVHAISAPGYKRRLQDIINGRQVDASFFGQQA